ncbi:MAG: MFS transporter [Angelakisella sp.]
MKKTGYLAFALLMLALGISDALRGVLAPLFQTHFALSTAQLSMVVTVSYLGNLVFLLLGGRVLDKLPRKAALMLFIAIWMAALGLFTVTDSYLCLLIGMFFAMGASTLLSTAVSLTTRLLVAGSPAAMVNILFFVQGIGTSGSQSLVGNLTGDFAGWKQINLLLLLCGAGVLLLLAFQGISMEPPCLPTEKPAEKPAEKPWHNRAFWPLVCVFGFYFIAEHGVMNWLVSYASTALNQSRGAAANYTAVFFGGIMVGRLLFSPLIDRVGIYKSLRIFGTGACILYSAGILLGGSGLWLLAASGVLFSILYPTLLLVVPMLWPVRFSAGACGTIVAVASLFDILFNFAFGAVVDRIGFRLGFLLMPLSMLFFLASLLTLTRKGAQPGGG